jgi:hypothetical protein
LSIRDFAVLLETPSPKRSRPNPSPSRREPE